MQPPSEDKSYFSEVNFKKYIAMFGMLFLFGILLGYVRSQFLNAMTPIVPNWFPIKEIGLPGSKMRELYIKSPDPIEFRIYVFHIANKDDVINGTKPILQEIGPYVFEEWKEKFSVTDNDAADTLTFNMKKTFIFRQDLSKGLTGNERITIVHPLIMAKEITTSQADALILVHFHNSAPKLQNLNRSSFEIIRTARAYLKILTLIDDVFHICGLNEYTGMALAVNVKRKPMLKLINDAINAMYHHPTDPFWTGRVLDYLFDGIEIDCTSEKFAAKAVCSVLDTAKAIERLRENFYKFSVFGAMNGTGIGMYEVKRGIESFRDVGRIISFDNKTEMDVWGGDECNRYKGTDSTVFPSEIHKEDGLWTYEPDLCMSIGAQYDRKSNYQGVPTMRFALDLGDARENKDLECYCGDAPNNCPRRGTRDLFDCIDVPVVLSLPHFYNADASILTQFHSGLNPNELEHAFFMDYERASGSVLNAVKRVQVNLDVVPIDAIESMKHLPKVLMPLFWMEEITETAPLNKHTCTNTANSQQYHLILQILQWMTIIGGAVGIIFSTYMHFKIQSATNVVHNG